MAAIFSNILSDKNNGYARVMMNWTFTPGAPSISSFTATNARTSVTLASSVSAPSTGTFTTVNVKGRRGGSTQTYKASGATVHFKIGSASEVTVTSGIYFNTTNSGKEWPGLANWSYASVPVGTSQSVTIWVTGFSSVLNTYYYNRSESNQSAQATLNLGTSQTTEYSKDNSTWQSSATFSSLTPNTTYTMYMRTKATSASGNAGGYTYKSVTAKTTGNAPTITAVGTPTVARTSVTFAKPTATYDTNASYSSQSWCSTSGGTYTSGNSATGLTPNTNYTYYVKVTDNQGRTSAAASVAFKTTGNAPTYNASAGSATRTSFVVTPSSISYDTNASFKSFKVEWGTSTSYGNSNTNTSSAAAYTVSSLSANTLYYWRTTLTDNQNRSTQKTGSITTTGNAPTVSASTTPARTSCTLTIGATYDTNASFSSGKYEYGTSTSYGTSVNISGTGNQTINNLSPNTTYYYKVSITDNKSRTGTKTGSFKTTCNKPSSLSMSRTANSNTSISVSVTATGDTNAAITNYTLYYKAVSASSYTSTSLGTGTTKQVTGLSKDSNYYFYFTATNAGGTTTSSTYTYSTTLDAPTVSSIAFSNATATGVTQTVTASGTRTPLEYLFSSDSGTTWKQHKRNLFDISRWSTAGVSVTGGASATFSGAGFSFTATNNDSMTSNTYHMTSSSPSIENKARASVYGFPVVAGTTYGFGYTPNNANAQTQAYVFWYDTNWNYLSHSAFSDVATTSRRVATFTAPANAVYASMRFDIDTSGQTVTFSNIYFGTDTAATYVAYANDTTSYSWSGLTPNTTYTFATKVWSIARAVNSISAYATKTATHTTIANKPVINTTTPTVSRTKMTLAYTATYETGASLSSLSLRYGTTSSYGSTSTSTTITGLQPNTTYYYSLTVTDTNNLTSDAATGTFTTIAYMPTDVTEAVADPTYYSINNFAAATGDTNATITSYINYVMPPMTKETYDMPIKVLSDGSRWARIFYHNCKDGSVLFSSISECKDTQTTDKYSRLGLLDSGDTYKIDDKYEFMLEYPIDDKTTYNRWKQTYAPQNEYVTSTTTGDGTATGYEAIHIDWTSQYWGGITRQNEDVSTLSSTWLSGSVGHGNSFYAIGCTSNYSKAAIPSHGTWTNNIVELWIHIDNIDIDSLKTTTADLSTGYSKTDGLKPYTDYASYSAATNISGTSYSSTISFSTLKDLQYIKTKKSLNKLNGYTILDYVQSTGAQYIDTGIPGSIIMEIDSKFNYVETDTGVWQSAFHVQSYNSTYSSYPGLGIRKKTNEHLQFHFGDKALDFSTVQTNHEYDFSWNGINNVVTLDGEFYDVPIIDNLRPTGRPLYIFATNSIGSLSSYGKIKLYYLNLFDNRGNALRQFIPVKRNGDNAVGLYDFVSETFFEGQGTSGLEAGPVAANPITERWVRGQLYTKNNGSWVDASKYYIKENNAWVKALNDRRENLCSWNSKYLGRFTITYDNDLELNKVTCAGASGWEELYKKYSTQKGCYYKVSFDYYNPNGYTTYSIYNGVACQALKTAPTDTNEIDNSNRINEVTLAKTANANIQRLTFNFVAESDITYLSYNFGMAVDNVTTTVWIGNIVLDKLENEFQEVEYVASDGLNGQYIDTKFKPNNNTRITIDYEVNTHNNWGKPFGTCGGASGTNKLFLNEFGESSSIIYFYYGSKTKNFSTTTIGRHLIDWNKNIITYDNSPYTFDPNNFQSEYNMLLFAATNYNGEVSTTKSDIKIYSCKIYSDGTLIRDYVPVYRTRDNAIGLYDKVNKEFYGNDGTGAFTKGSDTANKYIS